MMDLSQCNIDSNAGTFKIGLDETQREKLSQHRHQQHTKTLHKQHPQTEKVRVSDCPSLKRLQTDFPLSHPSFAVVPVMLRKSPTKSVRVSVNKIKVLKSSQNRQQYLMIIVKSPLINNTVQAKKLYHCFCLLFLSLSAGLYFGKIYLQSLEAPLVLTYCTVQGE